MSAVGVHAGKVASPATTAKAPPHAAVGRSLAFQPRIVTFLCNWCSYAGADLAGTSRIQYQPSARVIRVMCSARVDPTFVLKALAEGADGVLICGCHPGDCHYSEGNYKTMRRFPLLKQVLDDFGIEDDRVRLEWVSASEGQRFGDIVDDMTERIRGLGPSHVKLALATDRAER
jgi:F420-non-reducing hydrogenase iron-sulfur subunit